MPADLSKLSDADLMALKSGDLSKVSDEGLQSLKGSAAPQPSLMDKVSNLFVNPMIGEALSSGQQGALSATPAAAVGAIEGASLDTAKPIAAGIATAVDAGKDMLGGKIPGLIPTSEEAAKGSHGSLADKYQQYKKMLADKEASITNNHDFATGVGNVLGTAASAPLIPELGGGKAIGLAGKASPLIDRFLAGQAESGFGKIAGKGVASAIEGAPLGGLVGAAESNATNPNDFLKDVGSGAGMGSIGGLALGAGLQGVKSMAQGAPELAQKWDLTRKAGTAYNMGKDGMNFDTSAGKMQVANQLRDIPNQVTDQIMKVDSQLGQKVGDSLQGATDSGIKISIAPELQSATDELWKNVVQDNPQLLQTLDPKSRNLIAKLNNMSGESLSPLEARALKDSLNDLSDKMAGMSSDTSVIARQQAQKVAQALDSSLKEQIPEYADAAKNFAQFRSSVPEVLLQPELPADKRTKMLGSLKNKDTDLYRGASNVFGKAILPGSDALKARAGLGELTDNLSTLEKSNPDAVQGLGGTAETVGQNWKDLADKMAVLKQSQPGESINGNMFSAIKGHGEAMTYNMANRAGRMADTVGQSAPVQTAAKVWNAGNDQLMGLAQKLKGNTSTSFYGEALEKALNNKSDAGKNAVLFKLMQVPEYRSMLRDEGYNGDGQQQQ